MLSPGAEPRTPQPPRPARVPKVLAAHGDERVDYWYWMRDKKNPSVLSHLAEENRHFEAVTNHLKELSSAIFQEIVARVVETDMTAPVRHGDWWYYERSQETKNYPIHCRYPAHKGEPPRQITSLNQEEVLLDENDLADAHPYFSVGILEVSPDHKWLAYAVDTTGDELFNINFRRLGLNATLDDTPSRRRDVAESEQLGDDDGTRPEATVESAYYGLAWCNDSRTIFYTRTDETMRPFQLWRHLLGSDPSTDELVLEESDPKFVLDVERSRDGKYIVVNLNSSTTSEVWVIPADLPYETPLVVTPREPGIEYSLEHLSLGEARLGYFCVLTNRDAQDFKVDLLPDTTNATSEPIEVLRHRPGVRLESVAAFERWLVVSERENAEIRLRILELSDQWIHQIDADDLDSHKKDVIARSYLIDPEDYPSTLQLERNPEYFSNTVRIEKTSLKTPRTVVDVDLSTRKSTVIKREPVRGYDEDRFATFRLWADAPDGTKIPVSVVHKSDILEELDSEPGTPPSKPAPCLLYGYGAYEISSDPVFSSSRLSLLERGFIFAIAHVRGGGEMGKAWYEEGKTGNKLNSFTDFIACAQHMIHSGFTSPELMCARGASAGGLLVGGCANIAPELFRAIVAEVPFVDCLTTMMDDTLPLTTGEWEEWGDPLLDPSAYQTIKAYSPYDNVRSVNEDGTPVKYPDVLVTAGINDVRVGFFEPAKWVARLRDANPANRVIMRTEFEAGHGGVSGRYRSWREEALILSFLLDAVGFNDA